MKNMPRSGDVELVLLKGHLLIERMLQLLIEDKLPYPTLVGDAGLRFRHRLSLARAMYGDDRLAWAWNAARTLNKVRNELAHTLGTTKITEGIRQFITQVEKEVGRPPADDCSPSFDRLHWALFHLHTRLVATLRVKPSLLGIHSGISILFPEETKDTTNEQRRVEGGEGNE